MATASFDAPQYPMARASGCPFDPPPAFTTFREAGGPQKVTLFNGKPCWLFTSFADVRAVLGDNRFSTMPSTPGFPMLSAARDAVLQEAPTFIRMDPPEHGKLRRMFTKEFMVKRIDAMRPRIQALIESLYDAMETKGSPVEMVNDFALPLTSTVISEFLGVPAEDREFFQEQSRLKVLMDVDPEIPRVASAKLIGYFDGLLKAKERDPHANDDLLSRLVLDQVEPGHLSHDDAVRHADLLVMAGHETTANQIALGTLNFLQNPDQKALLLGNPDLLRGAVDEMLRYNSIVQFNGARIALEDVEVNGHLVRKGEGVFALINAANRDPAAFARPDVFDIERAPDNHLAFSYGVHQCLGQPLARAELQSVFGSLFQRFPTLRLAVPLEALEFKGGHFVYGVETLPLAW
ncbi:cytochrome P450 [Sphingomonas sp. TF3]|uniref:cytochrome P450 n=1 Tax=Sphingomonas sp. TF3 TaxID=2495580 RepID=UPI001C8E5E47|nr:cytochrome P450 [Sphingomonas sp. TF3]